MVSLDQTRIGWLGRLWRLDWVGGGGEGRGALIKFRSFGGLSRKFVDSSAPGCKPLQRVKKEKLPAFKFV